MSKATKQGVVPLATLPVEEIGTGDEDGGGSAGGREEEDGMCSPETDDIQEKATDSEEAKGSEGSKDGAFGSRDVNGGRSFFSARWIRRRSVSDNFDLRSVGTERCCSNRVLISSSDKPISNCNNNNFTALRVPLHDIIVWRPTSFPRRPGPSAHFLREDTF